VDQHRSRLDQIPHPSGAHRWSTALLGLPAMVAVAVLVMWPTLTLLGRGSFGALGEVLGSPRLRSVIWFTMTQAAVSTIATVAIGLCLVEALALRATGAGALRAVLMAPFALPSVVVGSAVSALITSSGVDRTDEVTWIGITVANVVFNLSVIVRMVGDRRGQLDDRLLAAASTLGVNTVQRWRLVIWPHLQPATVSAAALVFAFCASSYGVVATVGSGAHSIIEIEVLRQLNDRLRLDRAGALVIIQLIMMAAVLLIAYRHGASDHQGQRHGQWVARLSMRWSLVAWLTAAVIIAVPMGALVVKSLRRNGGWGIEAYLALSRDLPGVGATGIEVALRSLSYAAAATVLTLIVAVPAGLAMARGGRAARVVAIATAVPIAVSAVVIGVGMLVRFDSDWGNLRSRWIAIPLAHAMAALPVVARLVATARARIDHRQFAAAAMLGASPWQQARWVTAPLLRQTVVAAGSFSAAVSLGDFGAASVLARSGTPPIPVAIARLLGRQGTAPFATAMALGVVLAVACGALGSLEARRGSS
jgi:thiamine transport system permease protein